MSIHFEIDMEHVHRDMLSVSGVVEKMTSDAVQALCHRRYELVDSVLDADMKVDYTEVRIEEECLKMLALHQPVASDLRRIGALLKVNMDLERIGDLACNIAERARSLQSYPQFSPPEILSEMASVALDMLRMALDAFVNADSELANKVIRTDDEVDKLNITAIEYLRSLMKENSAHIDPAMHCFSAARHIENIADHAENISEDVIYLVDGEIVRHKHGTSNNL
jgi:phosphate transport system protein